MARWVCGISLSWRVKKLKTERTKAMKDDEGREAERAERCETCRFWADRKYRPLQGFSWCCRYPPAIYPELAPELKHFAGDESPLVRREAMASKFPQTTCDDWCGEWQPKHVNDAAFLPGQLEMHRPVVTEREDGCFDVVYGFTIHGDSEGDGGEVAGGGIADGDPDASGANIG